MQDLLNDALRLLCGKYSVAPGKITAGARNTPALEFESGKTASLLPWRTERRFTELKNMLDNGTLKGLSTLRFASITSGGNLKKQLEKEFDLAAFFTGMNISSVFAVFGGDKAANVIAKLPDGKNVCIECSANLPAGAETIDRHELIASRGVASDRAVDTQLPQSSIYAWTGDGETRYTDSDAELFQSGLKPEEILLVRAAFAVLAKPALAEEWNTAAETMKKCADAAFESGNRQKVIRL